MCLQWCHVTRTLIDNDLPCAHCPDGVRFAQVEHRCVDCVHHRVGAPVARYGFADEAAPPRPYCGLTRMALPPAQTCCHWNADLTPAGTVLTLTDADVARGLLRRYRVTSVAALFDESDTAPAYQAQAGAVRVPLADLAVPEIYGVASAAW